MRWVITGASKGLGRALAVAAGARGDDVVLVARGEAALRDAARAVEAGGGRALAVVADVGDATAATAIAARAHARFGGVDVVVHAASTLGPVPMPYVGDTAPADLTRVLAVNVVGPHALTRALLGPMVLAKRGVVVAISSDAAVDAYPKWGAYGAAKAALDHLTRVLGAELAGTGVRAFSIDPGEMDTEMHAAALPDADPTTLQRPEDVAVRVLAAVDDETIGDGRRVRAAEVAAARPPASSPAPATTPPASSPATSTPPPSSSVPTRSAA